ncbi:MAG: NAD-dependent epimerase/dehydratase family protein [Myxococcota bacterium]
MTAHTFVTGANGRVGQRLVSRLVADGHTVVGLARTNTKAETVRSLGASCLVGDLSNSSVLDEGLAQAENVFHLAGALRGVGGETPDQINRLGTVNLCERLVKHPGVKRVIYTSSCAIYGDRSGQWLDEEMPPYPNTRYGRSKQQAEDVLLQMANQNKIDVRVVRLAAVYGPGFPFMLESLIRSGNAWLPGEGRNFVPTIHIDDAIEGLMKIRDTESTHQIYNLADPEPVTLSEFYGTIARTIGSSPPRFWSTWIPSYVQHWLARNNERIQSKLPLKPKFTPDNLRLFTASSRLKIDRMEEELGMVWKYRSAKNGAEAAIHSQ